MSQIEFSFSQVLQIWQQQKNAYIFIFVPLFRKMAQIHCNVLHLNEQQKELVYRNTWLYYHSAVPAVGNKLPKAFIGREGCSLASIQSIYVAL